MKNHKEYLRTALLCLLVIKHTILVALLLMHSTPATASPDGRVRRLHGEIKERFERISARRHEWDQMRQARKEVCYDVVGCFTVSRKISPLKKFPESPETLETKFILFTRNNRSYSLALTTDDAHIIPANGKGLQTLLDANFDPRRPVKILIHGYRGSGTEKGALLGVDAFLKLDDATVINVDWEKGAAGPSYPQAVANTELVGRQTGLLLVDLLGLGVRPSDIHIVGFSLGAHIAAVASHLVQTRLLAKIGRITGLDPASPIFRSHLLVESSRKLDANDAEFVDVIHTDGSPVWTDGFGLLQPLGHVDFFPNGGREQPGCTDGRASVVVSHLEGTLDLNIACSHVRAWRLFVESLFQKPGGCQFMAYPCHAGLPSFLQGNCYPSLQKCAGGIGANAQACGIMGINSGQAPGRGALYLVTRDTPPYCGEQLRATVLVSEQTQKTRGILHMVLAHKNSTTSFKINCEFSDAEAGNRMMWGLAAAEFGTIGPNKTPTMQATLGYQSLSFQAAPSQDREDNAEETLSYKIYIDKLSVDDIHGNSWNYCGKNTLLEDKNQTYIDEVTVTLKMAPCSA